MIEGCTSNRVAPGRRHRWRRWRRWPIHNRQRFIAAIDDVVRTSMRRLTASSALARVIYGLNSACRTHHPPILSPVETALPTRPARPTPTD
jgi:hypothetical protein